MQKWIFLTLTLLTFQEGFSTQKPSFADSCVVKEPLQLSQQEEALKKRIYAHLLIADPMSAVEEGKKALKRYPESKGLQLAYIRALSEKGDEMEAMAQWQETLRLFAEEKANHRILETLAWGVLNKAEASSQLIVKLSALIGASLTRDAKAIPFILEQLRSSNALLRSIAVKLAASYPDAPIKQELERLFREEKVWYVRLEVIQTIGVLRMQALKPKLKESLSNSHALIEEKTAAMIALVSMYDRVEREELFSLIGSDRAGLRQLASEIIAHLNLKDSVDLILPLLGDPSSDVRISALNTLALLRVEKIGSALVKDLIEENVHSQIPEVAITAAYVLLLVDEPKGAHILQTWLKHSHGQWRRMASAALAVSGKYGLRLCLKEIRETQDIYVKINLARALIGQRVQVKLACQSIYDAFLQEKNTLWMWESESNPLFRSIAPSKVKHVEQIPNYPTVVDQLARLDLLAILSIVRFEGAQQAVRSFLQTQSWGVTGAAAATLLQEGDEEGLDAVRALIEDPDEKIRIQAALILAIVGSDPSAIKVLEEAYPHVDREMKMHILEALAHIGDRTSIPFLLNVLNEPFQVLRVIAASALIQCLYH